MRSSAGARSVVGMETVAMSARFAVPLRQGYDYISDVGCWPEYWPNLVRVAPTSCWSQPGDRAGVTLRVLGRATRLELTLSRIEPYRLIEYTSVQRGLPDARHERHFAAGGTGFDYRIVVAFQPRGAFDRHIVRRAVERAARQTLDNLERRFARLTAKETP
jgi:hypothetical protein